MFGKGKRKQFERLFYPHLDAAYNLARYLCANVLDAEDVVQESYLKAYRAFGGYTDDNSRAWILTITRNTCHTLLRKNNMLHSIPFNDEITDGDMAAPVFNSAYLRSPEDLADSSSNCQRVRQAIESLPVEFREVAVLRDLEGLSYSEIGLVLGIPKGTVMLRIARARKRLRILLADGEGREAGP